MGCRQGADEALAIFLEEEGIPSGRGVQSWWGQAVENISKVQLVLRRTSGMLSASRLM